MNNTPQIIFDAERMKYPHTGISHYCRQLANALLKQQPDHVPQMGLYLPSEAESIFKKDICRIKQSSFHKFRMPSVKSVKVWHSTYQGTEYFPFRGNHKMALTVHDLNFLYEKSSKPKQQKYLSLLQQKINRADAIITISEFVKREIETHITLNDKPIKVIYNGCNINDDIKPVKPNVHLDFPFIFTIGAIMPKKNFHVLPASLVGNHHHLVIAGVLHDGDYLEEILNQAKTMNVAKRVHYIGPVSEAEKYWLMQTCSLFSFPSLAEGFGLPVIEAMRFGKPVLLSTSTSLTEIGGPNAFYLDNFNAEYVSMKTNQILNNTNDEQSAKSVQWSLRFNWETAAAEYWNVYEQLCNE